MTTKERKLAAMLLCEAEKLSPAWCSVVKTAAQTIEHLCDVIDAQPKTEPLQQDSQQIESLRKLVVGIMRQPTFDHEGRSRSVYAALPYGWIKWAKDAGCDLYAPATKNACPVCERPRSEGSCGEDCEMDSIAGGTPLTDELTQHYPHFMPDVDVIGEWRASHRALEAALLRCLREIQPHHVPCDVYEQAQRALGGSLASRDEATI